jgi:predicted nucleic acid-binding protein
MDGQIAATASSHNLTVVTSNVKNFEIFEGLKIEDWRE